MDQQQTDYQISLKEIKYLSPKVNHGLELIFVINGEVTVEIDSRFFVLKEQDLLLINRNQLYQVKGNTSNSVLTLNITDAFIDQYYADYRNSRFECFSQEIDMGREQMLDNIRKSLVQLMISYCRKDESYRIEIQSYLCDILLNLVRGFKKKGSTFEKLDTNDYRLEHIIEYLERNYHQVITLDDMAKKSYLSTSYLSRYFKQKTGMGFSRFLMNIRLKHSLKDLLYTNDTISQIAMRNGFANTKSFTSLFKESYGITPHVYRENHATEKIDSFESYPLEDAEQLIHSTEILGKLGIVLNQLDQSYRNTESRFEELTLDITKPIQREISRPKHVVIVRELKELLKAPVRSQLLMVKEEIGLNYVGISNLLRGETITADVETDEALATSSPYFKADVALNFLKKHDLSLFIRIDYQEITTNEDHNLEKLIAFLKHCLQLYGSSYINTWHFLFYEPYYTAVGHKELRRVYMKLYNVLKKMIPNVQVGVFLPFSFVDEKTTESHNWLLTEADSIDFIGYHSNQNDVVDFKELNDQRFNMTKDYLKEKTAKIKHYLKKNGIEKPLHLVSWNTLSGNTRFTNGIFFRGALVLKGVLDILNEVESIGFWINTALHENDSDGQRIRIEGMELFHYFSGKRPAYFAMMFVKRLYGTVISHGFDHVLIQNERGYQLVLMNCNTINPYYSVEESFLQKLNKEILVKINGLETGEYQVRKYTFDRDHGALYTNWLNLNSKHGLDMEIIDYINRSNHPKLEIFDETIADEWSFHSYLTLNAIHYFEIRKAIF
ncbi:helix-turn-helix domain-containing protein [Ureibacillus manganicus]|uniref:Beta-xylosidase n=1 Tax=Ureibacillus manganicus DSM 26584 TaxID=1384049 RepID=A0A0A3HWA8_9BACL|nr:helix-turn-helix domain-containing protein [Ureibacillus manganicus]KGR76871.1 beta-xylosidase [Ureibacillus manganicus DSM 26584]